MPSDVLTLSGNHHAYASLTMHNGQRTLNIGVAMGLADGPGFPASTNEQTFAISDRLSGAELREIILEQDIEKICAVLPVNDCSLLSPVSAVAKELGLELSVRLCMGDGGTSTGEEVAFELFRHPSNRLPGRLLKRVVDLVGATMALAIASPVMLTVALAIKLTSRGPIFFLQPRVGRRLRMFRMVKFRTMVPNAEALRRDVAHKNNAKGISFKVIDDPRLTSVGSLLRRTSLDELPQLFNVLKGDMTLVGPRPIPTWVAEQLSDTRYHRRFSVLPGMTGLWQVGGRRQDFDYMATRDLDYVNGWSLWLDLKLLAKTPLAVLRGEGAH